MKLQLRKFTKFVDKTFIEGGKKAGKADGYRACALRRQREW